MSLPGPTGPRITVEHHPNKVAPEGHGRLHLCHARREHETIRGAGIAAERRPFTGISEREACGEGRGEEEGGGETLRHANQDVV